MVGPTNAATSEAVPTSPGSIFDLGALAHDEINAPEQSLNLSKLRAFDRIGPNHPSEQATGPLEQEQAIDAPPTLLNPGFHELIDLI